MSIAPAKARSHVPSRISSAARIAATTPVAQAAIGARQGPRSDRARLAVAAARFGQQPPIRGRSGDAIAEAGPLPARSSA